MSGTDRLEAYHFYEREWADYDRLLEEFEWEVPETFNMATYVCDRWVQDEERIALFADDGDGKRKTYTFQQIANAANALANAMRDRSVEQGDRVAINTRQRPETVIAHVACWKLGAVSIPLSTLFGTDAVSYV